MDPASILILLIDIWWTIFINYDREASGYDRFTSQIWYLDERYIFLLVWMTWIMSTLRLFIFSLWPWLSVCWKRYCYHTIVSLNIHLFWHGCNCFTRVLVTNGVKIRNDTDYYTDYLNISPLFWCCWVSNSRQDSRSPLLCFRLKHIEGETKLPPFHRRHFQMHFLEWKYMNFD